ncbi:MAG: hypothetical protein PVG39_28940 [Desulfobacteraceae bacterium]|jgi:hypothetical protein
MMETMQIPKTRAEFERCFHLLREQLKNGRLMIPPGMGTGLLNIRFLPNGRIDFLSVDESTRLMANMTAQYENETFKELIKKRETGDDSDDSGIGDVGKTEK